ncbi:hypothetical protein N7457_005707 [Penicillium paradoxum]|uniref:uncharacterized protein n=1 Tax=Penicillium paradoxum TaxID=176176 RepID=UPI002547DB11|nr:uncharacterized protein N7457_005707 [Penicillium paradoxum]KAJ5780547.1 hypothetical protein N7457_005707 [Penicillium paradoxum]
MFRTLCFRRALLRRNVATRVKPSLQGLHDEWLLNAINKLSVYDAITLSQHSRGIYALCDVKNRQKCHQLEFGREKYPQTHEAGLQAGLDTLPAILRTPSLGNYLRRVDLYGTGMIEWYPDYEISIPDTVLPPEDIDGLKQAILSAGFQDAQECDSILSMLLRNPTKFESDSSTEALQFKDALITLLIAAAPKLESISMYPLLEYIHCSCTGNYGMVDLLRRLLHRASAESVLYCQKLRDISFHPDDKINESIEYIEDPYYHQLNMARKLPAVESVAFKLVTWSNEAGIPPPPRSANYSKISFTHSAMESWDLCRIIESAKTLKSFTSTIGGRLYPEGGTPVLCVTPILKSLWIHRQTLEEVNLDMESQTHRQELYDEEYQQGQEDVMSEEERKEYEEQWADELPELAAPEIAPARVSLKDFPQLKNLSIGAHMLCYLARGTGDGKKQLGSEIFNLVDHIPSGLEFLRIYGYGEPADAHLDYESDLDIDAQIEQLAREKDAKLPGLKILEGVEFCIPNGRTLGQDADRDDLKIFWKDPDDNRFDDVASALAGQKKSCALGTAMYVVQWTEY